MTVCQVLSLWRVLRIFEHVELPLLWNEEIPQTLRGVVAGKYRGDLNLFGNGF